jgi:hypothetical protein
MASGRRALGSGDAGTQRSREAAGDWNGMDSSSTGL